MSLVQFYTIVGILGGITTLLGIVLRIAIGAAVKAAKMTLALDTLKEDLGQFAVRITKIEERMYDVISSRARR